ncbi:hypothetical protein DEJ50_11845 [Streptomyces venezuelae]|uniref:Uncharacterized protein n=1 Tax=Streptomyces venezuelae TaxID=54571 RepID=A0A5P2DCQ8_STRVZ|nr:hypothetical protein DEJ50_11845 [Streptomyces venezuelae]
MAAPAPAPAAPAEEGQRGTVWATPSTAEPGAQIELRVTGCKGTTGLAKSPVFVADADLSGRDGRGNPLYGEAMVSTHARPGWHTVRAFCDGGEKATGSLQIVPHKPDHHRPDHQRPDHHRPDHHRPDAHHTPRWPVHAGGGGMAAELATAKKEPEREGPSLPHTVIGGVLAAAAGLAVAGRALKLRRRRSGE